MKHTKGTWEIKRSGLISAPITIMSNSMTICRIFGSSEKETTEANAKLIITAPKMIKELILIAAKDGYMSSYTLVEEAMGRKISYDQMVKLADKIKNATI